MPDYDESFEDRRRRVQGIRKRTFTVVGPRSVEGAAPGETVELEFPEDVIDVLISAGFIQEQGSTIPAGDEAHSEDVAGPSAETRATRARSNTEERE